MHEGIFSISTEGFGATGICEFTKAFQATRLRSQKSAVAHAEAESSWRSRWSPKRGKWWTLGKKNGGEVPEKNVPSIFRFHVSGGGNVDNLHNTGGCTTFEKKQATHTQCWVQSVPVKAQPPQLLQPPPQFSRLSRAIIGKSFFNQLIHVSNLRSSSYLSYLNHLIYLQSATVKVTSAGQVISATSATSITSVASAIWHHFSYSTWGGPQLISATSPTPATSGTPSHLYGGGSAGAKLISASCMSSQVLQLPQLYFTLATSPTESAPVKAISVS